MANRTGDNPLKPDIESFRRRITSELTQVGDSFAPAQGAATAALLDLSSTGLPFMDVIAQPAMDESARERLELRRRKLQAALARINAGTFGCCCECEAYIEPERLESDPGTVFCFDCITERDAEAARRDGRHY
ncbi:MAG: molecular chaperone DnaK [Azoarcus sp.]|nr:molecular chaperone DnaK [Azoarcus sp.]